jgi:hypothetical protein
MVGYRACILLLFAAYACAASEAANPQPRGQAQTQLSQPASEPGYQCHFETQGDFGTFSASFDVPRSGTAPRGSLRWEAARGASQPVLLSAEWRLTRAGQLLSRGGGARLSAPLPANSTNSFYIALHVRADPKSTFTNPYRMNSETMLLGGGGLTNDGSNLYFFNASWRDMVDFARRHRRFYLFATRDLALNRPVIIARFEINSTPFIRADGHVREALDAVESMIANPAESCSAVDDLPPEPIIVTIGPAMAPVPYHRNGS